MKNVYKNYSFYFLMCWYHNLIKTKKNIFVWYSHEYSDHFVTLLVSSNEGIVAELESIAYEYMPIENFSVDSFKIYQKYTLKKLIMKQLK